LKWISKGGYAYATTKGLCEIKYKTLGLQIKKNLLWIKMSVTLPQKPIVPMQRYSVLV
jgi:hypothetical protein